MKGARILVPIRIYPVQLRDLDGVKVLRIPVLIRIMLLMSRYVLRHSRWQRLRSSLEFEAYALLLSARRFAMYLKHPKRLGFV